MANRSNQNSNQNDPPDARGSGRSLFSPVNIINNIPKPSPKWGIIILLILALVGYFIYRRGMFQIAVVLITQILIAILFFVLIIWGFKHKDEGSKYIALAFVIWLIDLLPAGIFPFFGGPYAGFQFRADGLLNTNWVAIFSGIFIPLLLFGIFSDFFKKRYFTTFIGISILWILNIFFEDFIGKFGLHLQYGNYILLGFIILTLILVFALKEKISQEVMDYLTFLFLILTLSFFWINDFWMSTLRAWFHVAFILIFGFIYVKNRESNPSAWHLLIPLFLITDFFLYNLLWITKDTFNGLEFIPILVIIVLWYCLDKEPDNTYARTAIFFILLIIIISLVPKYVVASDTVVFDPRKADDGVSVFSKMGALIKESFERGAIKATGGYYSEVFKSSVEKNQYEPLGVYFSNIRAAQPRFYSDEDVTLWGTIKSRTLNDPVVVNFSCSRAENGIRRPLVKNDDKLYPENPFTVYTLEETDVECTFTQTPDKPKLAIGANTITLSATYNFETSAYQKLYFIDRERLRAMTRESIDPYEEFGITDREPRTIHTNGPVELALKMQYLTGVSDESTVLPNLGILVQNRNTITDKNGQPVGKWEGRVRKINDLVLILPYGMEIEGCKPAEFSRIADTTKYCSDSCTSLCRNTCVEYAGDRKTQCENDCNSPLGENSRKCNTECNDIFKDDDPLKPYNSYKMDATGLNQLRNQENALEYRDFDRHKTFGCRVKITSNILENVPITTKFVRAVVRYDYAVEQTYSVSVEKAPDVLITQTAKQSVDTALKEAEEEETLQIDGATPSTTILGLVYYESRFRHCCAQAGQNRAGTCKATDESICPENRILLSHDGSSVGLMQINRVNWGRAETACADLPAARRTVFDKECNIKVGFNIIRADYNRYRNGASDSILARYCPQSEPYHEKYKSYRGLDAVLRSYNGWSCKPEAIRPGCENLCSTSACVDKCFLGTVNYVENVKALGEKVQAGTLQVPDVPEFEEVVRTQNFEEDD